MNHKGTFSISTAHQQALDAINKDCYHYATLSAVVENLIEEYLAREDGRLGWISNGTYENIKERSIFNSKGKKVSSLMKRLFKN